MGSFPKVNWADGQQVDVSDMQDEQLHHDTARECLEQDFHGEGVVLESRLQSELFDSNDSFISLDDGRPITLETNTTDQSDGNILEVDVRSGSLDGIARARLILIGVDRNDDDFMETMEFGDNEVRLTRNHYKRLKAIIPAGFIGSLASLKIREASSLQVDKDFIMQEQNVSPNVFLRDFPSFNPLFINIEDVIATTVSDVSILNIDTAGFEQLSLVPNDLNTIIGQKFTATTDNIQKVQLLLSMQPDTSVSPPIDPDDPNQQFAFTGDIVVSIRELETTTKCPGDVTPQEPIGFDPKLVPIAQVSLDLNDLEERGIRITDTPTPIDFTFSTTSIAAAGGSAILIPGRQYAVTIQRQGAIDRGIIKVDVGLKRTGDDALFTSFDGKDWLDNNSKDLWFRIFTDAAFVASGTAYDNGIRISINKTSTTTAGATISSISENNSAASTTQGEENLVTIEHRDLLIKPEPDPRTGNPVPTRIQDTANISLFTEEQFDILTNQPVLLGCLIDNNLKSGTNLRATYTAGDFIVGNTAFFTAFPAPFQGLDLSNHIFIPDAECPTIRFRVTTNTESTITFEDLFNPDPLNPIDLPDIDSKFANPGLSGLDFELKFFPVWKQEKLDVVDKRLFTTRSFLEERDGDKCLALHIPCDIFIGGKIFRDSYGSGADSYGGIEGYGPPEGYTTIMDANLVCVNTISGLISDPEDLQTTLEAIQSKFNLITGGGGGGGGGGLVDSPTIIIADGITGQDTTIGTGVKTNHIQDGAITMPKLADLSVGTDNLKDLSVTNAKLAANAVNTINLVDFSVTEPKLADFAVSTDKIQDGAVTPSKLSFTVGGGLPTGILLFLEGSTCPVGTIREASLDGQFMRGGPIGDFSSSLGSDTHVHPSHTHSGSTGSAGNHSHQLQNADFLDMNFFANGSTLFTFDAWVPGANNLGNFNTQNAGSHSHSLSISSATTPAGPNVPAHVEILICKVI